MTYEEMIRALDNYEIEIGLTLNTDPGEARRSVLARHDPLAVAIPKGHPLVFQEKSNSKASSIIP